MTLYYFDKVYIDLYASDRNVCAADLRRNHPETPGILAKYISPIHVYRHATVVERIHLLFG
jgi:hypothetical protein